MKLTLTQQGRRYDVDGLLSLSLFSALDTVEGADETLELLEPVERDGTIVVERRSTLWERAWLELRPTGTCLEVHTVVRGRGALTDVRLLGGRSALAGGAPLGHQLSGTALRRLFSPNPEDGLPPFRAAAEGAVTGVVGESEPGRARWLFTPAPLYWALGDERDPGDAEGGPVSPPGVGGSAANASSDWLDVGLCAPVAELRFADVEWEAAANGFSLHLEYDGHTHVDGEFRAPVVLLTPNVPSPWAGLRRHRDDLAARGAAPAVAERETPAWWREPIFCGWGAQCHLETLNGGRAADHATQESYDAFLERFVAGIRALRVGNPMDEKTDVGPLSTSDGRKDVEELVADAVGKGARVVVGGSPVDGPGWYYPPTLITGITPEMRMYREEVFGPVAALYRVPDLDAAIELANDTEFGQTTRPSGSGSSATPRPAWSSSTAWSPRIRSCPSAE